MLALISCSIPESLACEWEKNSREGGPVRRAIGTVFIIKFIFYYKTKKCLKAIKKGYNRAITNFCNVF